MADFKNYLEDQLTNISKASAYDALQPLVEELREENRRLREALKPLANLDLRGLAGNVVYLRNETEITASDVNKAAELLKTIPK